MSRWLGTLRLHQLTALVAVATLCTLTLLPDEHRHVFDDHDHHESVVHRHFSSHSAPAAPVVGHGDSSGSTAVWTANTYVEAYRISKGLQTALAVAIFTSAAEPRQSGSRNPLDDFTVHDSRLTQPGLRAPPA